MSWVSGSVRCTFAPAALGSLVFAMTCASPVRAQDVVQVIVLPEAPGAVPSPESMPPPPPPAYWNSGAPTPVAAAYPSPAYQPAAPAPVAREESNGAVRVLAEVVGWSIGLAATIGIGAWLSDSDPDGMLIETGILFGYFVLTPALVWGAGSLVGGHGSLGWTMLGNLVLSIFGAIGAYELSHAGSVEAQASSSSLAAMSTGAGAIPIGSARFTF